MKRVLKVVAFGVCLGLLLVAVQSALHIDRDAFIRGYWIAAPAVVIGAVLINAGYNIFYQRKMKKLVRLLDEGRADEYVAGVEGLLQTAKGRALRNILRLNLAAGYLNTSSRRYDEAVAILEELSGERIPGAEAKMVHRLNLCMAYFHTAQYDKALSLYQNSQSVFAPFRTNKAGGGSIALLDLLAALQGKELDRAERMLAQAKQDWNDPRLQEAFREIEGTLTEMRKEP